MDIKSEYEKLYRHWQKELNQIELSPFTHENFSNYKKDIDEIKNRGAQEQDLIKNDILRSYHDNLKYLLTDFLKIREIKIMNLALSLQEIDFNNLIEAEKMFYQNLVSSIKGFEKMKALSIVSSTEDVEDVDIDHVEIEKVITDIKNIEPIEVKVENKLKVSQEPQKNQVSVVSEPIVEKKKEVVNYTLLRFLKTTPALVGIDLKTYGPFEKDDVANIPFKNAKILLFEKFAEKLEIS